MTRGAQLVALALAVGACGNASPPPAPTATPDDELAVVGPGPQQLAAYLRTLAGADLATRQRAVASWKLDAATYARTLTPAYRAAYADYVAAFDAAAPALIDQLAAPAVVAARRHFADDPAATPGEVRARWMLPVLYPSVIATLGGAPVAAIFLPGVDGADWHALLRFDEVAVDHARALDPACADRLLRAGKPGPCTDLGYLVADAAMRADRPALTRACELAAARCR